jgi:hypothetical protein
MLNEEKYYLSFFENQFDEDLHILFLFALKRTKQQMDIDDFLRFYNTNEKI